jgi:hypothetical protein
MGKKLPLLRFKSYTEKGHTERKNSLPIHSMWQTISKSSE